MTNPTNQAGGVAEPDDERAKFDLVAHIYRAKAFSEKTFGPGARAQGVVAHIRKELLEIEAAPADLTEWVDVMILAMDGAWRAGHSPEAICAGIVAKQTKNEGRNWPDWRTASPDGPIEHVRSADEAAAIATKPAAPAEVVAQKALLIALACLRWQCFGECRTPGFDGPPPSPSEAAEALEAALRTPSQAPSTGAVRNLSVAEAMRSSTMERYVDGRDQDQTTPPVVQPASTQDSQLFEIARTAWERSDPGQWWSKDGLLAAVSAVRDALSVGQIAHCLACSAELNLQPASTAVEVASEPTDGAILLRPMTFDDGRKGWYVNNDDFYLDIEQDADGKWSSFFRHTYGGEAFVDQADTPPAPAAVTEGMCPRCKGQGTEGDHNGERAVEVECDQCKGTGRLPRASSMCRHCAPDAHCNGACHGVWPDGTPIAATPHPAVAVPGSLTDEDAVRDALQQMVDAFSAFAWGSSYSKRDALNNAERALATTSTAAQPESGVKL